MKNSFKILLLVILLFGFACTGKKSKSDIEIIFNRDTLNVGYTYWWPEAGPFIGNCGEELSLVFSGVVSDLEEPTDDPGPLYISKEGTIEIESVFKIKEIGEKTYANQKFFSSDCFYESGLSIGDTVLVICYDYEEAYSIPGGKSMLKISSFDDPIITSIKKYIDSDEDPLKLKNDLELWAGYGFGNPLEKVIECRKERDSSGEMEGSK